MRIPDISTLEKVLNNHATEEESKEIIRWFKTREGQIWLEKRMDRDEAAVKTGEEENLIDHPIPSFLMYQKIISNIKTQRIRRIIAYAAAILIPLALFASLFIRIDSQIDLFTKQVYEEIYVPNGERMQILFQDGSKVHLNSGSRIKYPKKFSFSERKIYLEGEAWFEITQNKKRPFIVEISLMNVEVLGTTFDIKAYPEENDISIALETGSIELKSDFFKPHMLNPGEKAVYTKSSGKLNVFSSQNVKHYAAWRNNVLVFNESSLSDVIKTLARTYNISFDIKDSTALEYTYTITTDSTNLNTVLKELEKITPVLFERKDGTVEIRMRK